MDIEKNLSSARKFLSGQMDEEEARAELLSYFAYLKHFSRQRLRVLNAIQDLIRPKIRNGKKLAKLEVAGHMPKGLNAAALMRYREALQFFEKELAFHGPLLALLCEHADKLFSDSDRARVLGVNQTEYEKHLKKSQEVKFVDVIASGGEHWGNGDTLPAYSEQMPLFNIANGYLKRSQTIN